MCSLLLTLLAIGDPTQVSERDIRLAIDLAAQTLSAGGQFEVNNLNTDSEQALLVLLNENPYLFAVSIDGKIIVRSAK